MNSYLLDAGADRTGGGDCSRAGSGCFSRAESPGRSSCWREGTQAIAGGDLNFRIPAVGDDEIGQLVDSFNQMTADLRSSAAELERRRRYTETLLRNVSAGRRRTRSRRRRHHDQSVRRAPARSERRRRHRPPLPGRVSAGAGARARRLFASPTRPREARSTVKLEVAAARPS